MIDLTVLVSDLNQLLAIDQFADYCPNGLQVEGSSKVGKVVTGVTASQQLINRAVDLGADLLLVHHGYFWRGEDYCITGTKKRRLATLLGNDISLLAYHLPLDQHPVYGNNIQLARVLGLTPDQLTGGADKLPAVCTARLAQQWTGDLLCQHIEQRLRRKPLHIAAERPIRTIAWCTGAAQSCLGDALEAGADAYLTGEVSEQTVHEARENNIHFFAAGHHATERYGVQALADWLNQNYALDARFIDCDNPV